MRLARVFWTLLALDVAVGLVINLILAIVQPSPAGEVGTSLIRFLSYFTEESNLFVLAAVAPLATDPQRDGSAWRILRVMSLLGITITGLVYGIVLAPTSHPHGVAAIANVLLHYVSPVMMIGGWLAFGPRPRVTASTLAAALLWPLLWIGYILAQGTATNWYPYNFLNVTLHGYATVAWNLAVILILGIVILALIWLGDRRLPVAPRRRRSTGSAVRGHSFLT